MGNTRVNVVKAAAGLAVCAALGATLAGCAGGPSEDIASWDGFEVTGANEITIKASTADPKCYSYRIQSDEKDGLLRVALIEKREAEAGAECSDVLETTEYKINTKAEAESLRVEVLPEADVELK